MLVHRLPHGETERCRSLALLAVARQNALDVLPVFLQTRIRDVGRGDAIRVEHRGRAGALAIDKGVEQRVGAETVAAVNRDAGRFTRGIQAFDERGPFDVGLDSAHHIVHAGPHGAGLFYDVYPFIFKTKLANLAELLQNCVAVEMAHVEEDTAVDVPSFIDFSLLGARDDISRSKFHHIGRVTLHEALALGVDEIRALAARALGHERAVAGERRGVVLHHFHVH